MLIHGRQRRAKLISERKIDPAVLQDIPQTPNAEEYKKSDDPAAKAADQSANNTYSSRQ